MNAQEETLYIKRILDGETELYSLFLDHYSRLIHSLVSQIISSPSDAEELVQDVFMKAFRNLSGYKSECSFSTWLYRIAYNTAISAVRKKKQEFLYIEENTIENVPDEKVDELLCPTDNEERIEQLVRAIDLLEAEEKAIITLFYYDEKPIAEITEILKITQTNVKVKLHRIRKKLYILINNKQP
ncbi:ECF RNA polymerase sigma factor SigW [termite gut metagenome]|uniref:ECF RNA polymerase sigma factor SigW n=1 Tax=termite gut metagenome TaxID=433724 RepID=A0A5J4SY58_9ZZZZ